MIRFRRLHLLVTVALLVGMPGYSIFNAIARAEHDRVVGHHDHDTPAEEHQHDSDGPKHSHSHGHLPGQIIEAVPVSAPIQFTGLRISLLKRYSLDESISFPNFVRLLFRPPIALLS